MRYISTFLNLRKAEQTSTIYIVDRCCNLITGLNRGLIVGFILRLQLLAQIVLSYEGHFPPGGTFCLQARRPRHNLEPRVLWSLLAVWSVGWRLSPGNHPLIMKPCVRETAVKEICYPIPLASNSIPTSQSYLNGIFFKRNTAPHI